MKRAVATPLILAAAMTGLAPAAFAAPPNGCVPNGEPYSSPDGGEIASGPHCYATPSKEKPVKNAEVDESKTQEDLERVENTSVLDPKNYLAKDSFAYRPLTGKEPILPNSDEISRSANQINNKASRWMTSFNGGGFRGEKGVGGNENIPIFTVDSSNPHQNFVEFYTTDNRMKHLPEAVELNSGRIPLPAWYKDGSSGDRSIAIYDVATGVWRSYFHVVKQPDGRFRYSSSGFLQGKPNFEGVGEGNYWLSLQQGTSSVVGMSNELTQIGVEEIRAGEIKHAVSMTWANYVPEASFPAKLSDGSILEKDVPFSPHVGQRFTLPADFDVDAWIEQNDGNEFLRMYMKAVQKYGGYIADKNHFISAANLEHPGGYAKYARQGKNVWLEDPEVSKIVNQGTGLHRFPLEKLQWMPMHYTESKADTVKTPTKPAEVDMEGVLMRTPEAFKTSIYQGETAEIRIRDRVTVHKGHMLWLRRYAPDGNGDVDPQSVLRQQNGVWSERVDGMNVYYPKAEFTGNATEHVNLKSVLHRNRNIPKETKIVGEDVVPWTVHVAAKDQPLARTDYALVKAGESQTVNVKANDSSAFGKMDAELTGITLVHDGREVTSYSDSHGTYSIVDGQVKVDAKPGAAGYAPLVTYRVTTEDGRSADGFLQVTVAKGAPAPVDPEKTDPEEPEVAEPSDGESEGEAVPAPKPPVELANDTATTQNNKPVTIDPLANDTSNGNAWETITLTSTDPKAGTWKVEDGRVTFTPNPDYTGETSATYRVNGKEARITITVKPAETKPEPAKPSTATPDTVTLEDRAPVVIKPLVNDGINGKPVSIRLGDSEDRLIDTDNGTWTVGDDLTVEFAPAYRFNSTATMQYTVLFEDGSKASSTITVDGSALTVRTQISAAADRAETVSGQPITINVLANDSTRGSWKTIEVTGDGFSVNEDGTITFAPAPGFTGIREAIYTATNNDGVSASAKLTVHVKPDPSQPVKPSPTDPVQPPVVEPPSVPTRPVEPTPTLPDPVQPPAVKPVEETPTPPVAPAEPPAPAPRPVTPTPVLPDANDKPAKPKPAAPTSPVVTSDSEDVEEDGSPVVQPAALPGPSVAVQSVFDTSPASPTSPEAPTAPAPAPTDPVKKTEIKVDKPEVVKPKAVAGKDAKPAVALPGENPVTPGEVNTPTQEDGEAPTVQAEKKDDAIDPLTVGAIGGGGLLAALAAAFLAFRKGKKNQ